MRVRAFDLRWSTGALMAALTIVALASASCGAPPLPQADFDCTPTTGLAPLTVTFQDLSRGDIADSWTWYFGDETSSEDANPTHTYTTPGIYTVSLTVHGQASDAYHTTTKENLITVSGPLARIVISPQNPVLEVGETQQFTAIGFDSQDYRTETVFPIWSVIDTGGTIEAGGLFSAGTTAGTCIVKVAGNYGGKTAEATTRVTLKAGTLDRVSISPQHATIAAGESQHFSATAFDRYGNEIAGLTFRWSAGQGGTITSDGAFAAGASTGTFDATVKVQTSQRGIAREATASVSIVSGLLDRVTIFPEDASVPVGGSLQMSARALEKDGDEIPGLPFTWSLPQGGGSIDEEGLFTAGTTAGTFTVKVKASRGNTAREASTAATVLPGPVDHLTLSPATATVQAGDSVQFAATAYDLYGNEIEGLAVTWSLPQGGGSLPPDGLFTAGSVPGTFTVRVEATANGKTFADSASVVITAAAFKEVVISPQQISLLPGASQQFSARAIDQFGNEVPGITLHWRLPQGGGTIDQNGLLVAGLSAGTFTVEAEATLGETTRVGTATVSIGPAVLYRVTLTPLNAALGIGEKQQFTAVAFDSHGEVRSEVSLTWSLPHGGGSIDKNGLFTAGTTAGTFTVEAEAREDDDLAHATTTVLIRPDYLYHIVLSPAQVTLDAGATAEFSVAGFDRYGNEVEGLHIAWRFPSGGGNMDEEGVFRAGASPGTFPINVEATQNGFTRFATATVIVLVHPIAFASDFDGDFEIFVINPDGSSYTQLTFNNAQDRYPAWSPDRTKIAFASNQDGNYEIYVMNADGSGQVRLTNNPASDEMPSWSPDGSEIVFSSDRDGNYEIYIMNADGSNQRRLTTSSPSERNIYPRWSPDGTRILYSSSADGGYDVWVVDIDGSNPKKLTEASGDDIACDWSRDGSQILFVSTRDAGWDVYTMSASGGNVVRLTTAPYDEIWACWAPGGTRIAYISTADRGFELYTMNSDGTYVTRLTRNAATEQSPDW